MLNLLKAKHLCKKCKYRGETNDEGMVYCEPVNGYVEPVLRRDYGRYENCPHRPEMVSNSVPSEVLKQLAEKARELGISSVAELAPIERDLCAAYRSEHS